MLHSWSRMLVVVGLLSLAVGQGCAEERAPINRVQANAISKSNFVRPNATTGEYIDDSDSWYFRATITDVPSTQNTAFIGAAGDMSRVKWRIEEQYLVAYREDPDVLNTGDASGGVIAAFPITSHFDIRRSYNATTGEEANVTEENTTDRPWRSREYMRVDWSTNKLSEKSFVAPGFERISAATWYEQDPASPDHPTFEPDYVDITARYSVSPDPETCFYYYRDFGCGPGDVSARLSFMKVPARDFSPREYPDRLVMKRDDGSPIRFTSGTAVTMPVMDQFGFFRTQRAVYDSRYGTLEDQYLYRASVWNIWKQWFKRDAQGNVAKDVTGKQIELSYSEREVRPVVYFVNPEWPENLKSVAQATGDAWDDAFQETVASLRIIEKKGQNQAVTNAELRAEVEAMKTKGEHVLVTCVNNPTREGDPKVCLDAVGGVNKIARQGDLRYSFMYWVNKPQPGGPLGFGPSYPDPITGELMTASAYIYGAALDTYSQFAVDIINLLNGKYQDYDYIDGIATALYAQRLKAGLIPGPTSAQAAAKAGRAGFDLESAKALAKTAIDPTLVKMVRDHKQELVGGSPSQDKLKQFATTALGKKVLDTPELHAIVGKKPTDALSDADLTALTSKLSASSLVKQEQARMKFLGEHGCFYAADFADDAVFGLARELAKKYPLVTDPGADEVNQRNMWQDVRGRILLAVLQHEVGHTVGLRHNFEGSSDALNFFDEYWTQKTNGGRVRPQFGDAPTTAQRDGRMTEFQYSTVMDYGSRFNSDIQGLGKYDHAAVRFGYGDLVEAWPQGKLIDPLMKAAPGTLGGLFDGYSAEAHDFVNRQMRHYTQLPGEFSDGIASMAKAGREVRAYSDVVRNYREKLMGSGAAIKTTSGNGGVDVIPYRFCGDEYAGVGGNPLCDRFDSGMDPFEIVADAIDRYRAYYVFDAFPRGRVTGFNQLNGYLSRIVSRYFIRVHQQYVNFLFDNGPSYWSFILNQDPQAVSKGYLANANWDNDPAGGLPAELAIPIGLDELMSVIATPDVGSYTLDTPNNLFRRGGGCNGPTANCVPLDISTGARFQNSQYDGQSGYEFYNRIKAVGSFYDKIGALLTLSNSDTTFIGRDQTNLLTYRIGFYLLFPKQMTTLFGSLVTDKFDAYAWKYNFNGGTPQLRTPTLFPTTGMPPITGVNVDPSWYFYYKGYALLFSMANFQAQFSQSWNDAVRVYCIGCGEGFTPAPGTTTVTMNDPLSGKQYAAVRYGDGRYSPGAELVAQGATFVTAYDTANALPMGPARDQAVAQATGNIANQVEMLDLVRGLYNQFGYTLF